MKTNIKNKIMAVASMSAVLALCGTTALADPQNSAFLSVDMDGAGGPTQAGFVSIPVPSESTNTYGLVITTNFPPSSWVYSNQYTPTGAVTVIIVATNDEYNIATNIIDPFPSWISGVGISPNGIDRGSETNGNPWGNLYEDFLCVSHDTDPSVGFGDDQIWLTISNLVPNTNYEITVWDFDQAVNDTNTGYYVAWGPNNPDPYGTNSFEPGADTLPRYTRVPDAGPEPTNEYTYSKSFFVTSDANGTITVYGWEDDNTFSGFQWVPFNGFAIGVYTNSPIVITNPIPILPNPPLTALGPPTVWGYNAAAWNIYSTNNFVSRTWGNPSSGVPMMGEAFVPSRDMMLRNFYMALQAATNTGLYTLALYDLGATNVTRLTSLVISNSPDTNNLLSHPDPLMPQRYWSFVPTNFNLTNMTIVKFKLPALSDQVYLTNGHTYFFGLQYVPGSGSDNLVWEGTPTNTYTDRAGFNYATLFHGNAFMTNTHGNLIMAIDGYKPNPVISVTNYALTNGSQTWPTLPGMANGGNPVITVQVDANDTSGGENPGYLDFISTQTAQYEYVCREGGCPSMSFYNTNTFYLGAVAVVMRGVGSSNVLFTLNVFQVTNTFFTRTDSIEYWPRNFRPSTDTRPLSLPVWGTNVDFYFPTNLGVSGSNQILVLTLPTNYQATIYGTNVLPYKSYAVEFCAGDVGENADNVNLFKIERDNADSGWQNWLFPDIGGGAGYRTNPASGGVFYNIEPETLRRPYPDPERLAGGVVGAGVPRQMVMALYAAPLGPPPPPFPTALTIVSHIGNNTVLNWSVIGGPYTCSVFRTNVLSAAITNWPAIATNLTTTNYTDTTATGQTNFYIIRCP